eukprot:337549-Hanusia_phi.AAC.1
MISIPRVLERRDQTIPESGEGRSEHSAAKYARPSHRGGPLTISDSPEQAQSISMKEAIST